VPSSDSVCTSVPLEVLIGMSWKPMFERAPRWNRTMYSIVSVPCQPVAWRDVEKTS